MAEKMFQAMEFAYNMSEAEWLKLKNRVLLLRRHHIRALRQLQVFAQRGIAPTHPLYLRALKRLRHLEKRIERVQHQLAHANLYDLVADPAPLTLWGAIVLWVRHVRSRLQYMRWRLLH